MPHLNALYQTALRLTQDRHIAEQSMHELCDAACKALSRGDEGWANCRLALFRTLYGQIRPEAAPATHSSGAVGSVLDDLSFELRATILLIDCHGFSYREAAEIMRRSVETVADRLTRARDILQNQLAESLAVIPSS